MKAVVTLRAVPLALLLASSFTLAQTTSTGKTVGEVDWNAIGPGSPIPEHMPAAQQSDDPLEAGFARQWIERVENPPWPDNLWRNLALAIASQRRTPGDQWASLMEKELREILRNKVHTGRNSRVFCNSLGCLCYVERDEQFAKDPIVYMELVGNSSPKFGLQRSDLDATVHPRRPGIPWELTILKRPASDKQGSLDTRKSLSP